MDDLLIGNVYEVKYHPNLMVLIRFVNEQEVVMYDRMRERNYYIAVDRIGKKVIDIKEVNVESPEHLLKCSKYIFDKIDNIMREYGLTKKGLCRKCKLRIDTLDNRNTPLTTLTIEKIAKSLNLDFRDMVKGVL